MNLKVGQVVYLLSKKENKVFPAQVVEEVTRKTLEEEEISYVVKMPDKEGSKVPLDDLDVDIFKNEKEIKAFMIDNSTKTINRLVDWAEKVGSKMFQETVKSKQQKKKRKEKEHIVEEKLNDIDKNKDEKIKVDLGNGVIANVSGVQ